MEVKPKLIGWIAVMIALSISSCHFKRDDERQSGVVPVRIAEASSEEIHPVIRTSGRIVPASEQRLSFRTGGFILNIYIKEGQYVKTGQLLAELNLTEINATMSQAEELYSKALRDFTRVDKLFRDTVATLEQFQNAFTAMQLALSSLEVARFNKLHSSIHAPSNGRILRRLAEENEMIGPGHPVFLFGSEKDAWQMKVSVSDRDMVNISLGDSVIISLDAYPGQELPGRIAERAAMASPYTGLFELVIEVDAFDKELISGMIGRARIFSSRTFDAICIPIESLLEVHGEQALVHILNNGEVARRNIEILGIEDKKVLVLSGLGEGEKVITEGTSFVKPGSKLEIINESVIPEKR